MFLNWWRERVRRRGTKARGGTVAGKTGRAFRPGVEELETRTLLQGGTWAPLSSLIPDPEGAQHMILLSNGSIMVQGGNDLGNETTANRWYALTPNSAGNYVSGTWSTLTPMSTQRQFFGSAVLPTGKLLVVGGEDSGNPIGMNETNTGEIYDPVANAWSAIPNFPQSQFGDNNLEVLQNGSVLGGYLNDVQTYLYHPATNNWTFAANKLDGDPSAEETWVKLPDGSIISYVINGNRPQSAQRYVPALNQWVFAGNVPVSLGSNGGNSGISDEEGPAFLLPGGRVFWLGASNHTALYTPPITPLGTGSWVAGPDIPNNLGVFDGPGCVLPNGDVFFLASPQDGNNFTGPTNVFEYNPSTNTIAAVAVPPALQTILNPDGTFTKELIVLPSGQVMLSIANRQLWVFTPNGAPQNSWRPTISSVTSNGGNIFTLSGTQLNGLDEGSLYGDDHQNATNYPIVRITDSKGKVFFARTFNWSSVGVATGSAVVSTEFVLPTGIAPGPTTIVVIANGIPSLPFNLSNQVRVFYPLRYVYNPLNKTYSGNLTLYNLGSGTLTGTFTILFPSLPRGSTLLNPTGYKNGVPFIQIQGSLIGHGASIVIPIVLTDPLNVALSTFFLGFPVTLLFGI